MVMAQEQLLELYLLLLPLLLLELGRKQRVHNGFVRRWKICR
jgi:hypothetical protein